MNLIQSIFSAINGPTPPLHVGEVMAIWTYAVALDEGRSVCLLLLNHTSDPELKRAMEHYITAIERPQAQRLNEFLRNEGVMLPPTTADKPKADERVIPPGAKMTENEVANMFVAKILGGMTILSNGMIQSLRNDVGQMLLGFYLELLKEGFTLKETMRKRGWLKVPPTHSPGNPTPN